MLDAQLGRAPPREARPGQALQGHRRLPLDLRAEGRHRDRHEELQGRNVRGEHGGADGLSQRCRAFEVLSRVFQGLLASGEVVWESLSV